MGLVLKREDLIKRRKENRTTYQSVLFNGDMRTNAAANVPSFANVKEDKPQINRVSIAESGEWVNSKAYWNHMDLIESLVKKCKSQGWTPKMNVAQFPSDYYDLIDAVNLDITRRRLQEEDFTDMYSNEITNFNFSKSVSLSEFLPYTGKFEPNNLAGDTVPLIDQRTGAKGSVEMSGYALGDERSLEDVLYNLDIWSMQKMNDAYIRAFRGIRNNLSIGTLVALTTAAGWNAGQQVAASAVGGSDDNKLYNTINDGINKLISLYDFQTRQEISVPKIVAVLGSNVDTRNVSRVVGGQLDNSKAITENRRPLEIDEIWQYKGDSYTWGKEKVSYPGVESNKMYLLVPGSSGSPNWTLTKRPLTTVTSEGNAHNLGQGKTAKYFVQTKYDDEFLGSSSSNTTITADTSKVWGHVVEVTLP